MIDGDLVVTLQGLAALEVGNAGSGRPRPYDSAEWSRLEALVRAERLEPQLARAVRSGWLPATPQQSDLAEGLHQSAMAVALLLDRRLVEVSERFEAASIPLVVLKGAAVAHLDYPDPARRAYGDVDVLVPASHIDRAAACLGATGARRAHAEPRPGFDRRFGKGMSFRMSDGLEVDVHRTLVLGPFGLTIDLDDLLAAREGFVVGGRRLQAMDRTRRFVHACLHAALGRSRPRLVPLMDLVMTAPRTDADIGAVVALTRRWEVDTAVLSAVASASRLLGWAPASSLTTWLGRLEPTSRQRRWLAGYHGDRRSSARLTVTAVEALDGWRERAAYVRAVTWPSGSTVVTSARRFARGASSWARRSS